MPAPFVSYEMHVGSVFIVLPVLLAGWYIISSFLTWQRLRHIPGPFLASLTYLWNGRISYIGKVDGVYRTFEDKYGKLVRVGPEELITSDPELIRKMGASKSDYSRGLWYDGGRFNPYHPAMISILDTQKHDDLKAKVAPGYSGRDFPGCENAVDEQLGKMIGLIRHKYVSAPDKGVFRDFSLVKPLMYFPLDVIFRLSTSTHTGGDPSCSEQDNDQYGFYSNVGEYLPTLALTTSVPWARSIFFSPTFLRWFGPKETDSRGMGALMKPINTIVRQRFADRDAGIESDQNDALASFMKHGLTQPQCEVEAMFMFIAGSDTTSAAMRITMLHILSTPRVYQRLKSEVATALCSGTISSPIKQSDARNLPYLQAVIYEGLRIRPVATSTVSKKVPPQGDTIHGHFIPGGTNISTNFSALLRSKELFGPDADTFRPERFLGLEEAKLAEMRRNVELTFGYGRWMCAGKAIAFMELNKVYFELFRYFDFQLLEPERPMIFESYALCRDYGLRVRVTEAEDMV
ncbi:hypothetical protein VMCG_05973 [Cytospora schulzeri]|uniref:Pisatin demethylase n=1 Tax=Cytospora schulzeri TaxID=448051 RepID=A0A423WCZ5_9PEZI|nr:hypothetical protein VMCG_05973 [Valsa malicola]